MILVVDNHGFTTRILTHQLGAVRLVTAAELRVVDLHDYTHVVLGHGTAADELQPLHEVPHLPVLAIGAGYQQLADCYGHTATTSAQPVYGQPVEHQHTGCELFAGLPDPVELISYHAWRLHRMDPERFTIHASDDNDAVLAFRVNGTNHWGLHGDPAALQSPAGHTIIQNFLGLASHDATEAEPAAVKTPDRRRYEVYTRTLRGELDTVATFAALQDDTSAAFWLDSASADRGQGRLTVMGTNAGELTQTLRWNVRTNELDVLTGDSLQHLTADVFDYLEAHLWEPATVLDFDGYTGGWVGYLGYEAKQATVAGHQNRWEAPTPDAYWIQPQAFLRYDHRDQSTTLVAYQDPALLDTLEAALVFGPPTEPEALERTEITGQWRLSATEYEDRVGRIQKLLHAGTAAGVCLTDTFSMSTHGIDGLALYRRLRSKNPAPYAGYLRFNTFGDSLEVLSASPEKYLSIDAAGTVESKPIKGTVARSADPTRDAEIAQRMAADAKIQSENLMITDLLRDDLAAVTVPASVQVPKLMAVESFATVHQLVTTVTGQLLPETSAVDALKAVFPGGSMTGAPKHISLETLDVLEAGPRGIYSGAMGWIGHHNTAELNVVIRTVVINGDELSIGAGGAVVVDSDPVAEEQEKHLKARALMDSIAEQL
ncbi:chorismate-binding protein [Yaniella halotolerans]|uniref:chorismate-binding protein n=1 Tax=Yaniella halotolerans TaxID=225453 RepID=UPI0003B46709|nr:chorismate-binding protein [Yaniella halotolerans]